MNVESSRFISADQFRNQIFSPAQLHRYVYAANDPANKSDPKGTFPLAGALGPVTLVVLIVFGPIVIVGGLGHGFVTGPTSGVGVGIPWTGEFYNSSRLNASERQVYSEAIALLKQSGAFTEATTIEEKTYLRSAPNLAYDAWTEKMLIGNDFVHIRSEFLVLFGTSIELDEVKVPEVKENIELSRWRDIVFLASLFVHESVHVNGSYLYSFSIHKTLRELIPYFRQLRWLSDLRGQMINVGEEEKANRVKQVYDEIMSRKHQAIGF